MTQGINVSIKRGANNAHAILAIIFWLVLGIVAHIMFDNIFFIIGGIAIGVVRLFVINDKYAWQVATLDEIQYVKSLLLSEKDNNKILEIGRNVEELRTILRGLENQLSYSAKPNKIPENTDKQVNINDSDDASYMQINLNGRLFAMKGGKLYCPKCHSFVDSDTQTMCSNCGYSFM